ncbi:hypothetical protein JW848_03695 [Candidatus Bipolaricaulota bacterium]|nr:hypothetical protein [Candidatus Bipolaricaulota bacterium]
MKTGAKVIVGLVIVMLVGISAYPGTEATGLGAAGGGGSVPLPVGDELSDEQLLQAEGELWWFVIGALLGAAAHAGGQAIHENWFDEEYGIDRDDRRMIALGAVRGAMEGFAGVCPGRIIR